MTSLKKSWKSSNAFESYGDFIDINRLFFCFFQTIPREKLGTVCLFYASPLPLFNVECWKIVKSGCAQCLLQHCFQGGGEGSKQVHNVSYETYHVFSALCSIHRNLIYKTSSVPTIFAQDCLNRSKRWPINIIKMTISS